MAFALAKPKFQISVDATQIFVTDITGQYDAITNTGGWGAPNPELSESAVIMYVVRVLDGVETEMTPVGNIAVYDPGATNTKETKLEFVFSIDGHLKIIIFRLPVSLDGSTKVEGGNLGEGDFFYWNNGDIIWQIESGFPVAKEVTDLIGEGSVVQSTCESLPFPKLALKYNADYTTYMEERDDDDCDDAEMLFQNLLHFRVDLAGAAYRFKNGSVGSAEDIIESLLKKHDITS